MKIIVCAKIIKGEINPFDACALETALRLSNDVTVVSMGPMSAKDELTRLTRLGAKVVLLNDNAFAGSDTLATSHIISCAIQKMEYDLIICGRQTIDGDTAQVGPCLATMLGINVITNVLKLDVDNDVVKCETRLGFEESRLPALLTVERICDLRFPSIFSKAGEVTVLNNSDIGADLSKCGLSGSPTRVLKTFESEKGKRTCKFISFDELDTLVERLLKKTKESIQTAESEKKFKSIWAIGHEVEKEAYAIAEEVVFINETNPFEIAKMAKEQKPEVILWNADICGRRNAPIVSALLDTGLCADCTALETDGENLYMYSRRRQSLHF